MLVLVDRRVEELAQAYAALGSPERARIVGYLLSQRGPHCGEIAQALGMTGSAFSYHLRVLEGAGLVARSRDGRRHCLSLTPLARELLPPAVRRTLTEEGTQWKGKLSGK